VPDLLAYFKPFSWVFKIFGAISSTLFRMSAVNAKTAETRKGTEVIKICHNKIILNKEGAKEEDESKE